MGPKARGKSCFVRWVLGLVSSSREQFKGKIMITLVLLKSDNTTAEISVEDQHPCRFAVSSDDYEHCSASELGDSADRSFQMQVFHKGEWRACLIKSNGIFDVSMQIVIHEPKIPLSVIKTALSNVDEVNQFLADCSVPSKVISQSLKVETNVIDNGGKFYRLRHPRTGLTCGFVELSPERPVRYRPRLDKSSVKNEFTVCHLKDVPNELYLGDNMLTQTFYKGKWFDYESQNANDVCIHLTFAIEQEYLSSEDGVYGCLDDEEQIELLLERCGLSEADVKIHNDYDFEIYVSKA